MNMREYRVAIGSGDFFVNVNGVPAVDEQGNDVTDFLIVLPQSREVHVLDVFNYTWRIVATILLSHAGAQLVLNEETGQCYNVVYERRGQTHDFPTTPPIAVSLIDF